MLRSCKRAEKTVQPEGDGDTDCCMLETALKIMERILSEQKIRKPIEPSRS